MDCTFALAVKTAICTEREQLQLRFFANTRTKSRGVKVVLSPHVKDVLRAATPGGEPMIQELLNCHAASGTLPFFVLRAAHSTRYGICAFCAVFGHNTQIGPSQTDSKAVACLTQRKTTRSPSSGRYRIVSLVARHTLQSVCAVDRVEYLKFANQTCP